MSSDKKDINSLILDLDEITSINHNLTTALKKILNVPRNIDVAKNILQHENCTKIEQETNIKFLENIEKGLTVHTWKAFDFNETDYAKYSLTIRHLKDYKIMAENEDDYLTNRYIESIFSRIFKNFSENSENYLPFEANSFSYPKHDIERLNAHLKTIVELYLYKAISLLAHHAKAYDVALMYHDFLMVSYSGGTINESYDSGEYFRNTLSKENTRASNVRWSDRRVYRQQKKREYLKIKKEQGFTKNTDVAKYIKEFVDKGDEPKYDYVYKLICEASNGNFK